MRLQQHCQCMDWSQQSVGESSTADGHDRQMDLTPFEAGALLEVASLYQLYVNAGMIAPMTWQKGSDQVCDDLRGRANFERPGVSAAQRLSMFSQKLGMGQQLPAALQQVFAVGRQPKAAANVFEEGDAELGFQRLDLSRSCRLTEIQTRARTAKSAHFGGHDESAQRAEVYHCCAFCMIIQPIFAFDTTEFSER